MQTINPEGKGNSIRSMDRKESNNNIQTFKETAKLVSLNKKSFFMKWPSIPQYVERVPTRPL